jgi:hypothetical protein
LPRVSYCMYFATVLPIVVLLTAALSTAVLPTKQYPLSTSRPNHNCTVVSNKSLHTLTSPTTTVKIHNNLTTRIENFLKSSEIKRLHSTHIICKLPLCVSAHSLHSCCTSPPILSTHKSNFAYGILSHSSCTDSQNSFAKLGASLLY